MIKEVTGDLLLSKCDAIAHGIAPNDNFHQGLALSLRELWPAMYKDFRHYCRSAHPGPGELWAWKGPKSSVIYSLFTQEPAYDVGSKPGRARLEYVNHSLETLRKQVEEDGVKSLAISRVATGVGGLDWEDVKPLVQKHLGTLKFPVYVYTVYKKNVSGEA